MAVQYFQYISSRIYSGNEQVFFWLYTDVDQWAQSITSYDQAHQVAQWVLAAAGGKNPPPLDLAVQNGTLSLSSEGGTANISAYLSTGTVNASFDTYEYGWMLYAVAFSVSAGVPGGEVYAPDLQDVARLRAARATAR